MWPPVMFGIRLPGNIILNAKFIILNAKFIIVQNKVIIFQ